MGWTTAIIRWNVLVCFLCLDVVRVGGQDEPIISKGAIVGQPLVLPCGLPQAKRAPPVTWVDFVHNVDEDPITIFDGINVVASHPKAERYSVGSDYSLTIANVSDADPGEYVCRSKVGRTVNSASYIVLVADLPRCAGETSMDEGDDLLLTCTTNYWGSEQPDVRWFRGDEPVTDIVDRSVISEAQYVVDSRARWQDDKLSYQCRVSVDGLAAHCEKILSVTYTVRNIQLGPVTSTSVAAGDYVTCSAKGNPEPEVTLSLKAMSLTQKGSGTQRILVANDWVGKNLTFDCEARNTVPGKDETVVASTVILYMREKPTTTPLPTTSKRPPPKSVYSITQPVSDLKAASAGAGDNMYGIIIGIAIGVLAVIVIIVAVICLRRRKQQDKRVAGGKNGTADSRKMEDGRRTGGSEEKQPLTANHEQNASVSVNGEKARYSPTKA